MATSADLTDICRQIIHLVLDDRLLSTIESHHGVDRTERLSERIGPAYRDQIRTDLLDAARALAALYAEDASDDVALSRIGQLLKSTAADCRTYHNEYVRPARPERCFAHFQQLDDISRALQQLGSREFVALISLSSQSTPGAHFHPRPDCIFRAIEEHSFSSGLFFYFFNNLTEGLPFVFSGTAVLLHHRFLEGIEPAACFP